MTAVPGLFFSQLLPLIDDLAELKVLLFCLWALPYREGPFPYLRRDDFLNNAALVDGLRTANPDSDPAETLAAALSRAVEHGALLHAQVMHEGSAIDLYFVNTERGRGAIRQIDAGAWQYIPDDVIELLPERPNIYQLYEDNIGPLTPMIADDLKDTEKTFPAGWIEEAIRIAVQQNKRSLRYMRAILERWRKEGKDEGEADRKRDEQDGKRYVSGEYADFIEH
ncbi:MAG: DnaD domain-containing protein [Chloroflexota bacterium]